ncbi:RrF2 family transcriptional regulator [Thiomonas bhubaneswarensis]|uniref:Transcriptional regulator, BadM/Rrf2 family n=1 Tax=Thiomonas bhubaneswarensis TaxID=339866 RepID=A0A0K6I8N3_9BURK|nr:Rrf2 family transcriptional regulator [Thiomonas bhubaneswarensis]CUA99461.1 transcriptional regulator, BadM/Rrf2 family [Thiomonas bhubaneswarensis]
MRLTSFSDFGLRALLVLAGSEREKWSSVELAAKLGISREHLVKVLQRLAAGGFVDTLRGAGGGVRLARKADQIRLGEVLAWLEDDGVLTECFRDDGGHCLLSGFCALRPRLERARQAFYAELDTATLADCLNPRLRRFVAAAV